MDTKLIPFRLFLKFLKKKLFFINYNTKLLKKK